MDRASRESHTKRLSVRTEQEPDRHDEENDQPLYVRALDKLGFEADFSFSKPDLTPATLWDGTKQKARFVWDVLQDKTRSYDKPLFIIIMVLIFVGFIMMSSASYAYAFSKYNNSLHFITKQFIYTLPGVFLMILVSTVPPKVFRGKVAYILMFITIGLLIAVLFSKKMNGVTRWLELGPITIQPSEIAKFAAVLVCSTYISYHYKEINMVTYKSLKAKQFAARNGFFKWLYGFGRNFQTGVWPFLWRVGPILGLLLLEPHLSCAIIIGLIVGTMMFLAGTRGEYFFALLLLAGIALFLVVVLGVVPYGRTRFEVWMDPFADAKGAGWQNVQSLYAISSGGIFGAGFGNSRQKYMYISEPQNDFIFAVICEELGLVGAVIIILIFVAFIWRGFALSLTNHNRFERFVGIGITLQIGYQMILNVAVVTNLVPNTGISLPFFSSGGSSILMLLAEMGVLLAISRSSTNKIV